MTLSLPLTGELPSGVQTISYQSLLRVPLSRVSALGPFAPRACTS